MFALICYLLKGDLTQAETEVDYLPFAKVLTKKEMDSRVRARRMEALYYQGVKRIRKCAPFTSEEKTPETI